MKNLKEGRKPRKYPITLQDMKNIYKEDRNMKNAGKNPGNGRYRLYNRVVSYIKSLYIFIRYSMEITLLNQGVRSQGNVESTDMRIPTFIHRRYKLETSLLGTAKTPFLSDYNWFGSEHAKGSYSRRTNCPRENDPAVCVVWCIMIVGL